MTYMFLPSRGYNMNALDFYLKAMEEASSLIGEPVERIESLEKVKRGDKVMTTTVNDSARVLLGKRGVKVYTWYQGIAPEEMAFNAKGLKKISSYLVWSLCDIISLWGSRANIYVSEAMARHYRSKYFFFKKNYAVMPCFNQKIEPEAFRQEKYDVPSFVYSGSAAKWQCFDKTVELFVEIKKAIPEARFSVFTNMIDKAREIVSDASLADVDIRSVSYKELPNELRRFKYGFLIRDNHPLNRVATPTKMSSYLGCGVIPVFSPVIKDFNSRLGHLKYAVIAGDTTGFVSKLKELESCRINAEDVLEEYRTVFDDYYCREKYIRQMSELFRMYN